MDADNTFKTLINAKWGVDKESQMQNEYQSAVLGLLPESYKEPYLAFLSERLELKAMIEGDFLNNASE